MNTNAGYDLVSAGLALPVNRVWKGLDRPRLL